MASSIKELTDKFTKKSDEDSDPN